MKFFPQMLLALALSLAFVGNAAAHESSDQTISYLISYVEKSDATFIRNGASHTPAEAAQHIKAKYEHFRKKIKTPDDFIRLAASKSLLSGKPYLVRPRDGKEISLETWLTSALNEHRAAEH